MTSDPRGPSAGTLHHTGLSALSLITHQEVPLARVSLSQWGTLGKNRGGGAIRSFTRCEVDPSALQGRRLHVWPWGNQAEVLLGWLGWI